MMHCGVAWCSVTHPSARAAQHCHLPPLIATLVPLVQLLLDDTRLIFLVCGSVHAHAAWCCAAHAARAACDCMMAAPVGCVMRGVWGGGAEDLLG